ncbi:MAG: NAD-dependent dehydratase [Zetaproteobacteria bacterium CG12_big_fil_rev_8_21_14_0_65_55_1124]|nr:MAG: NAD-dependent dehydratase [Zetaproteobacteria bacterium CG1_02_55_237]PIS18426.1 MAG: NAD-dependent dehydratase [Zetaproteobacteria bacterium CG08_land_8_20_14_0_20_55_17]PIW43239.1 MAG: NAD-dependent dehydratase [Zetaproteobacteria bacterium CG12_big_fil_rev_8_21_14_0_65_55_1124]PIY51489.1 MAG: NAD-dependent dehydratase [Zetaproteobacteria bacterium CG_4_10_14_0_8_um_filter_55_43]PIZ39649.1 MAG: NAD-dependent dehydratase [Zetaproteobacteria bacterium CG_4_10_14_0_2_um_filter_55_20]PJB
MSKQISIIGGSGFVGRAIARQAVEQGMDVTIACRHPERARDLLIHGIKLVKADICSGRGLDEAVKGAACVINLVGLLFERGPQTFSAAHVHGTEHLLAACERAGTKQYIHMSALGADLGSLSSYAHSKAEAEQRVRTSKLKWTIIRPSIIYGARDSFFNRFRKLYALAPVAPLIGGNTRFQPVWVEDVARAFVSTIGRRVVNGKIYELCGPEVYSLRELMEMMLQELGWKRLLIDVPQSIAGIMARVMQLLPTPPLTRDQLILLKQDNVASSKEAFPAIFGKPAALPDVLPACLQLNQRTALQQKLDRDRKQFWANS